MARNWDEPFGLYGLLAESIETGPEREWVEFTLRPEARFSDGSPVTVEDVIWSMETLSEKGLPRYGNAWEKVASVEQTGERSVRFGFNAADSELPLIIGLRPILKKADWEGIDFAESSLRVPVGSGPYTIGAFEPGRFITFERNPDYWGQGSADQPGGEQLRHGPLRLLRRRRGAVPGVHGGGAVGLPRGEPGEVAGRRTAFPAVASGEIVKAEIPHGRPSGMEGFVFNTRRPIFQDWRVRDALLHAFNFEFVNQTLNGGAFPRRASYFANSDARDGRAGRRRGGCASCWSPSRRAWCRTRSTPMRCRRRTGRSATGRTCGRRRSCSRRRGGRCRTACCATREGAPFGFEILLTSGQSEAVANIFTDALRQLGIEARVKLVDQAQYNAGARTTTTST